MVDPSSRLTVLHVDDDPAFLDFAAAVLEREDERISVISETSAADGLARLYDDGVAIDCVVSDYQMPDMDGIEFLVTVRSEFPDVPFVLLTSRGSEEVASQAISAGVTDYLQKEPGLEQYALLANRLDVFVSRARLQARLERVERELVFWKEFAPAAMVVDPDGTVLTASVTSRELLGVDRLDEVVGADVRDFVHPDEREEVDTVIRQAQREQEGVTCRNRTLVGLDGDPTSTTVQWKTITHFGRQTLLAVMNDFSPDDSRVSAPS